MDLRDKGVVMTGAGCLGAALATRLLADGARLTVVDNSSESLAAMPGEATTILADITDRVAMKEAALGSDVLIHTAAVLDGDPGLQEKVNVEGAATVAEAASEAGIGRLVHVSSNAVYGISHTTDITEDMGPSPSRQVYSMTKAAGELEVRRIAEDAGLEWTVVRPAGIFGPGARYFSGSFYRRGRRRPVFFVGKGGGAMYCSFVDDVADLIVVASVHPDAVGEVFNCAIDPPPTQRQYMAAWSRLSGHESYLGVPMFLAKFGGLVVRPFASKGSYLSELNANLDYMDRYVRIDCSKARDLLGWEPAYGLEDGVAATVPWLIAEGLMEEPPGGATAS